MSNRYHLGDLQLAIMRILWEKGEATVVEVHAALLPERGLAPTTISTMLKKMEEKGVVDHRTEGRQFVYGPTITEDAVKRSMVSDLTNRLFLGDAVALASHLVAEYEMDQREMAKLKVLIEKHERRGER